MNDTFGHAAGDLVIRTMGARLTKIIGDHGLVCRVGGDEFMAIYYGPPGPVCAISARRWWKTAGFPSRSKTRARPTWGSVSGSASRLMTARQPMSWWPGQMRRYINPKKPGPRPVFVFFGFL
ncbi:diguanylate cyclase [Roseibium salinum]|nr:diguanylate cyclase [Roseibium salinum]